MNAPDYVTYVKGEPPDDFDIVREELKFDTPTAQEKLAEIKRAIAALDHETL